MPGLGRLGDGSSRPPKTSRITIFLPALTNAGREVTGRIYFAAATLNTSEIRAVFVENFAFDLVSPSLSSAGLSCSRRVGDGPAPTGLKRTPSASTAPFALTEFADIFGMAVRLGRCLCQASRFGKIGCEVSTSGLHGFVS